MRDLWRTIVQTGGAKLFNLVIGIAFLGLTARWLGPEGRGQLVATLAWVMLFATLGHLSLGQVALHRIAAGKATGGLGETLGSLLVLAGGISVLGWMVAAAWYVLGAGRAFGALPKAPLLIAFAGLPLYLWEQYGSSLLISQERVTLYNRYQMAGRTAALIGLLGMVAVGPGGVAYAVAAAVTGQGIIALGGMRYLLSHAGGGVRPSRKAVVDLLAGGLKLHLNAIGAFVFGTVDVLILNSYRGAREAGFYQLAVQWIGVIMILPQAVALVLYGRVAAAGPDAAWPHQRRILLQVIGLVVAGAAVAAVLAPWVITLVAGSAFLPSVELFRWLLLATVGMTCSTVMAPQWIGRGLFWQAALLTVGVGIATTVANLLVVPVYGMRGAAWSAVGSYTVSLVSNACMVLFCNRRAGLVAAHGI